VDRLLEIRVGVAALEQLHKMLAQRLILGCFSHFFSKFHLFLLVLSTLPGAPVSLLRQGKKPEAEC